MNTNHHRRHLRYRTNTPVFIVVPGTSSKVVPGLVSKLSRSGMELYAGVNAQPGDLIEVEFRATGRTIRVAGTVRHRSFFCFGLEFCDLQIELQKQGMPTRC